MIETTKPIPLLENSTRKMTIDDINFLPKSLLNHIIEVSRITQTPLEYAVYFALSFLSSLVMDKFQIKIKEGYLQPLSIPAIVLGKTGDGKTSIYKAFQKPLIEWEKERIEEYQNDKQEIDNYNSLVDDEINTTKKSKTLSRDQKFSEIKNLENGKRDLPINPCFRSENITPEGIRDFIQDTGGKLAVIDTEESGFLSNLGGRYSNSANLTPAIKGWDGDSSLNFRSSKGVINIDKTNINWTLFTQPRTLQQINNLELFIHQGLIARTLISKPPTRVGKRDYMNTIKPIDKNIEQAYNDMVDDLLNISGEHIISFDEVAQQQYRVFEQFIETHRAEKGKFSNEIIGGWVEKLKNNLARIVALITIIENPNNRTVSGTLMDNTIKFSEILIINAEQFFNYITKSKEDFEDDNKEAEILLESIKDKIHKWKKDNKPKTEIIKKLLDDGFTASYLKHKLTYNKYSERTII